jgi:hypothetical protein
MKITFPAVLLTFVLASCAQSDNEPVELATEYKQIVTMTIDSLAWSATSDGSLPVINEVISAEVGEEGGKQTFSLTAWNVSNGSSSSISLYSADIAEGRNIALNGAEGRASFTSSTKGSSSQSFLTSDSIRTGTLRITSLDTNLNRISGTFECKLGDFTISNGSFDVRYARPKAM